jgi:hypothetical protein
VGSPHNRAPVVSTMFGKQIPSRQQLRAMQRERVARDEKRLARAMGLPKGLRQYCKNLGSTASDIARAYLKAGA